jgi:ERCC4-related helicase
MPSAPALSLEAAQSWIYPSNYPPRAYQLSIVQRALFENTLVCLPTGLGKTLIAAVVMYNFYLWYPSGSVIFLVCNANLFNHRNSDFLSQAPTKPLVSQQIKACRDITNIPEDEVVQLDGAVDADRRYALWKQKRVFFCTPQVLENDLASDTCDGQRIVCIVFDEAHRATGNYSYVKIVRD